MLPERWVPPCGKFCTKKYSSITQIPCKVYCKKGCTSDGETWEECLDACDLLCYKDPIIEGREWSAYIDRSPGHAASSQACFYVCVSGCGFRFDMPRKTVDEVRPKRPMLLKKPDKDEVERLQTRVDDDMPSTSA